MREFLVWVAFRPRSYADAMEAWGSHCPRFSLWEDALERELIELENGSITSGVRLTVRGRGALKWPVGSAPDSIRAGEVAVATSSQAVVEENG
jgi:hypothetical protein